MPIYAYRCESCGFTKDALQKVSDAPLTDCPSCGKPTLKKQVTAAGFQLKGTGWYVTDFRNGSGGTGGTSAPAPAQGENKSEAKSETKSEIKSEPATPSSSGTADAA